MHRRHDGRDRPLRSFRSPQHKPHLGIVLGLNAFVWLVMPVAAQGHSTPRRPLDWTPCFEDAAAQTGTPFECAEFRVPLDYRPQPHRRWARTITLSLVRIPATATPYRGSLFLNPGGPGGSGVDFAVGFGPFAAQVWGPVANRFDIVGFDPRGIARSTPLRCFNTLAEALEVLAPVPFPVVKEEVPLFVQGDERLDEACEEDATITRDHMSTANVARDLELLRQAVGDRVLNYVGLSYGSYLGQTYANLFPNRVGALVIDGVLDPIAWANVGAKVPFSTALRSDAGAQATLNEFLRQCDTAAAGNCALACKADDTDCSSSKDRLDALLRRLREGPISLIDPTTGETSDYIYASAVTDLLIGLYNPFGYAALAEFFALLESQAGARELATARARMQTFVGLSDRRRPYGVRPDDGEDNGDDDDDDDDDGEAREEYPNFVERFPAVACSDTTNPTGGHRIWFRAGRRATQEFGIFGEPWTWASSPCASWSHVDEDVYKGPFDASTRTPVLVIGNFYDPATRYEGALVARYLLSNSVLLSVDEPGHTSLGLSACAGSQTGLYLERPDAYASRFDGFTCPQAFNRFDAAAGFQAASGLERSVRSQLMDLNALRP